MFVVATRASCRGVLESKDLIKKATICIHHSSSLPFSFFGFRTIIKNLLLAFTRKVTELRSQFIELLRGFITFTCPHYLIYIILYRSTKRAIKQSDNQSSGLLTTNTKWDVRKPIRSPLVLYLFPIQQYSTASSCVNEIFIIVFWSHIDYSEYLLLRTRVVDK